MSRHSLVAALGLVLALGTGAKAKGGMGALLKDGFPEVTAEEKALTEVPFAPGAPAVVLQDVQQSRWDQHSSEIAYLRVDTFRRVKVLTQAGVEEAAQFVYQSLMDQVLQKVAARTVLPDGRVIDAKDQIFTEFTQNKTVVSSVRLTFPQVQVGAILDVRITRSVPYMYNEKWAVQDRFPVLLSRYVLIPPEGMRLRAVTRNLPPETGSPQKVRSALGEAFVWTFENVAPLADEANMPPEDDSRQVLYMIPMDWADSLSLAEYATDWKTWQKNEKEFWDTWANGQSLQAKALAAKAVAGASTPVEKAEAIRRAVQQAVRVRDIADEKLDYRPEYSAPDLVLAAGAGRTGDVAGLVLAMLRSVDVQADPVAYRSRSSGSLIAEFPIPSDLDDVLVRITTDKGPVYFSPSASLPVGTLPFEARNVLAMPMDGKALQPVQLEDFAPGAWKAVRTVKASLAADGTLEAESNEIYYGLRADAWRGTLEGLDEAGRADYLARGLRRHMPGATLTRHAVEDAGGNTLVIKRAWSVPGYATRAGERLLVGPVLLGRVDAADWSPATRHGPIDLGGVEETADTVTWTVPAGSEVTLPQAAAMPFRAGEALLGEYHMTYQKAGSMVVTKRRFWLGTYQYPKEAYPDLKTWFLDVARTDDQPLALRLP